MNTIFEFVSDWFNYLFFRQKYVATLNEKMKKACKDGDIELVHLLIKKGANSWYEGMCDACEGGHLKIVKLMILKGKIVGEKGSHCWNDGAFRACNAGHNDVLKFMIRKGATDWFFDVLNEQKFLDSLTFADYCDFFDCEGIHTELKTKMKQKFVPFLARISSL